MIYNALGTLTLVSWVIQIIGLLTLSLVVFSPFSIVTVTVSSAQIIYYKRFQDSAVSSLMGIYLRIMRGFMLKTEFGIIEKSIVDY